MRATEFQSVIRVALRGAAPGGQYQWIIPSGWTAQANGNTLTVISRNSNASKLVKVSYTVNGVTEYDERWIHFSTNCSSPASRPGEDTNEEELLTASDFTIFPNPSTGHSTITLPFDASGATVSVSDVSGRVVLTNVMQGTSHNLDLSSMAKGIYFVKI